MASRALARVARGPEDYARMYGRLLRQVSQPVIIHWLGEMFDPALEGYWGSPSLDVAGETLLDIVATHATKIDGVKLSLLDQKREIALRRRFPAGVHMYSGDDFDTPRPSAATSAATATRSLASSTSSRRQRRPRC